MTSSRYILTLEAAPDRLGREPAQRLQALLKYAGRACGLRCVSVAEVKATPAPTDPNTPESRSEGYQRQTSIHLRTNHHE